MLRRPVSTDKRFRKTALGGDHGTPERWQHSGCTFEPTDRPGVLAVRATEEHILDRLGLKLLLSARQIAAGLKFKADYHAAAIGARVTGSYAGPSNVPGYDRTERKRSDAEDAAYRRWRDAVREMGLAYSPPVIATVCLDEVPKPHVLSQLQVGLDKLAGWYGLTAKDRLQEMTKRS